MPGGNFCAECGSRLRRPFAACERCGYGSSDGAGHGGRWDAPTASRVPTGEDPWHRPDHGAARSAPSAWRRPALLVPLAVLLALLGVGGGLLVGLGVLGDDGGDGTAATADDRAERGQRAGRVGVAPDELRFTCWTGNPSVGVQACPDGPDESRQGFSWVFPRVDFERCRRTAPAGRTMRSCELDGVRLNFSLWESPELARTNYVANFAAEPEVMPAGRVVWDGVGAEFGEGEYKSAVMYAEHPWSMTVYASSEEAVSAALYRYWMRAAGELRGAERR